MEDTSLAIHPEKNAVNEDTLVYDIGNVIDVKQASYGWQLVCQNGFVSIRFYRHDIVRITMDMKNSPSGTTTFAVIKEQENVQSNLIDSDDHLILKTTQLTVHIDKFPCRIHIYDQHGSAIVEEDHVGMAYDSNHHVICYKKMEKYDHFYGFGEKTGFLDKRGEKYTMWNSDVYAPHNPETDPLYQSIPYFMTLREGRAHGLYFDNSYKTTFNMKADSSHYSVSSEGGHLDYYVFFGPTPKDVIEQYTTLTGRMPLPPKWAIGYHQSRYSYKSEQEVRDIANTFIEKGIPLDAIYLDIHYMDGYRVFTYDQRRFPNPEGLIKELKKKGIQIVPIVDPGVKVDPEYNIYQEGVISNLFCKYLEGNLFFGDVWPGKSAFPDFANEKTRKWWGEKHRFYSNLGIEGIWNDMNEPAVFNDTKTMDVTVVHDADGTAITHREFHNLYGLMMGEATYHGMKQLLNGKRPFLLTRAGFAGIQRYGAVWTGDNRSFWEHLEMSIPMVLNLGVSGIPFAGPDVGGFAHDSNGELLTRWTQVGAFTPFFRNHSAMDVCQQEPWSFGPKYEAIIKKYINLRYKWLPHLYTLFKEASRSGIPVMRPLFMVYPEDSETYGISDQFMIGDNVMAAPILRPHQIKRMVYFPEGRWINYWNGDRVDGGSYHLVDGPLDILPLFIREGSILVEADGTKNASDPFNTLTVHIYPTEIQAEYIFYDDDGITLLDDESKTYEVKFMAVRDVNKVNIETQVLRDSYLPSWKDLRIVVHDVKQDELVYFNKNKVQGTHVNNEFIFVI